MRGLRRGVSVESAVDAARGVIRNFFRITTVRPQRRRKEVTMDKELHFYSNGVDTLIAESPEDAIALWESTTGESFENYEEGGFELLDLGDNGMIKLHFPDDEIRPCDVPRGGRRHYPSPYVEATEKQWIEHSGRCFFSSTEY